MNYVHAFNKIHRFDQKVIIHVEKLILSPIYCRLLKYNLLIRHQSNLLHVYYLYCNQTHSEKPIRVIVLVKKKHIFYSQQCPPPPIHSHIKNYFRFYSDDVASTFLHLIFIFITHIEVYLLLRLPFDFFFVNYVNITITPHLLHK